ncbi:SRPBCC family protein [Allorhizocola rhizosphaerae]|uniref:SRPBCC family protein n=1 Tax=Allorhizocola rhizosphaerae TaxID=1872709 RepID=UPI000E3E96B9|nr:SRPBCC family protein [Allorhizocola rhizosphaerae]
MEDFISELGLVQRELSIKDELKTIVMRRSYDAEIEDVWDAVTNPERLPRWFLPVSGDFRLGGRYQIEGNAGGEVLRCEPPRLLRVSWIFGEPKEGDFSEVEVRLSKDDDGTTRFELEHTATVPDEMWAQFGPGAVGVGWDGALLGLALHFRGELAAPEERAAWIGSPEAKRFNTAASELWGNAHAAAGASPEQVEAAVRASTQFYTGE